MRPARVTTLVLLFGAGTVNFLDRASLSIANTSVRADLHLTATQMGWLLSWFSLSYGFAQLPLMELLGRVGSRRSLGAGLFVWSTAQLLTGYVRGFAPFAFLRTLLGLGEAPFYPAAISTIRESFSPSLRGRATAVISSSQNIALAAAPPVLTFIMLRLGWRAMFVVLGALGLIVAFAWLILHHDQSKITRSEVEEPLPRERLAFKVLLQQRAIWGIMLGWGGINYTAWLYMAWLPGYFQGQRHLSVSQSGWLTSVPFLAGALGMHLSGVVADRRSISGVPLTVIHRWNLVVGMLVSAASTLLVTHCHSTIQAAAAISVALFTIHYAGTSGWGYVQAVAPQRFVGEIGALQNFAGFLIASVAPIATGWSLDRFNSFTLALALCSVVTSLGALSYATLAKTDELQVEEHRQLVPSTPR